MNIAVMMDGGEVGCIGSLEVHMAGGGNRAQIEQREGIGTKPLEAKTQQGRKLDALCC